MLIAFQKNSQNRERGEYFHWRRSGTLRFTDQHTILRSRLLFTPAPHVFCAFRKLPQFSSLLFLPLFGMLASSPTEPKPSYSNSLLFSRLYFITPKQGHTQHTHLWYSRCGRAPLSGFCSFGKLRARWQA